MPVQALGRNTIVSISYMIPLRDGVLCYIRYEETKLPGKHGTVPFPSTSPQTPIFNFALIH